MNLHEYQAKQLFAEYGLPVSTGYACDTPEEAAAAADKIGGDMWVVKCQVHAGGRGKAGGVKLVKSKEEIRSNYRAKNITILENLDCLSDTMLQCDISIGAGGTTTWERFSMGLPSLVISIAANQEKSAQHLSDLGLIYYLGPAATLEKSWLNSIKELLLQDEFQLLDNSSKISQYVDTLGSQRIVTEIFQ